MSTRKDTENKDGKERSAASFSTTLAEIDIVFGADSDGREIETVMVTPAASCISDGSPSGTRIVRPLRNDTESSTEIRHRMVSSLADDVVYVIVMKRLHGDTPKVCKVMDACFYMTRQEAEEVHASINEFVRNAFEVRAVYMSFAPVDVP